MSISDKRHRLCKRISKWTRPGPRTEAPWKKFTLGEVAVGSKRGKLAVTAEHSFPKSISEAEPSPNLILHQTKAPPGAQAAAEEGLFTPTRCTSFQTCPLLLETELLIKHHLPGSVEANWGWAGAKEKLPKYILKKKKIPPPPPIPTSSQLAWLLIFLWMSNTRPWVYLCAPENPPPRIRLSPVPPFAVKSQGVAPRPQHTSVRARAHAQFSQSSQEKTWSLCVLGGWMGYSCLGSPNLALLLGAAARGRRRPCKAALGTSARRPQGGPREGMHGLTSCGTA